jgi:hypothetical protein
MMAMKSYLIIGAVAMLFSSCLKQSIPDAMLDKPGNKNKIIATLSYEVNGAPVSISVEDADNPLANNNRLDCTKLNGYILSGVSNYGDFIFTFFTDSLKVQNYRYTSSVLGPTYVTTFGAAQYIYGPADYMSFTITSYANGHISGNFSGRLTPQVNNYYGTSGSTLIMNGLFNNVPVIY